MASEAIIYIVDDNADHREILSELVSRAGFDARDFSSGVEFLQSADLSEFGCIVLDNQMPNMTGLDVQQELKKRGSFLPIIFISGGSGIPDAVMAMQSGAVDFLEKPIRSSQFVEAVTKAVEYSRRLGEQNTKSRVLQEKLDTLTNREREIYDQVVAGLTNKLIADKLNIKIGTVEFHRANMMRKLDAESFTELMELTRSAQPSAGS